MQTNYEAALRAAGRLDESPASTEVGTQILTELVPVLALMEALEEHLRTEFPKYDADPVIQDAKTGLAHITRLARAMKVDPVVEARNIFRALCTEVGSDYMCKENAILSVGREFLPPCALAVLDDRDAATVEYYDWLCSQIAAGHEWHKDE